MVSCWFRNDLLLSSREEWEIGQDRMYKSRGGREPLISRVPSRSRVSSTPPHAAAVRERMNEKYGGIFTASSTK